MKKAFILTLIVVFFASFTAFAQNDANAGKNGKTETEVSKDSKKNKKAKVAEITFESLEYDYGNIYKGDNGVCEFKFKNTGKAPLTITKCQASCGCTVPAWPKDPIAPGKTAVIRVKYDTNRIGTINKSITVSSDAINNSVVLHIKGYISEKPVESAPVQDAPMMKAN